ncbi:PREDICTED: uncharacterized protein LOC105448361 [Wasmannia auropunctata]|uniref:uncharacterized protein LOC105448361 n=1 Tax=Wasmannia auropunctata TaxID=64793 RepID=UPI0005F09DC9|nr:PREDICTED: uncharacterized protein LOC105448361 [Wasmannia auropunctata]
MAWSTGTLPELELAHCQVEPSIARTEPSSLDFDAFDYWELGNYPLGEVTSRGRNSPGKCRRQKLLRLNEELPRNSAEPKVKGHRRGSLNGVVFWRLNRRGNAVGVHAGERDINLFSAVMGAFSLVIPSGHEIAENYRA